MSGQTFATNFIALPSHESVEIILGLLLKVRSLLTHVLFESLFERFFQLANVRGNVQACLQHLFALDCCASLQQR